MEEQPNLSAIQELSRGDKAFENKLLGVIKKELPLEIAAYKKNLKERDFTQTAEIVHKLKHKISILGFEKGYQTAIDYEEGILNNDFLLQNTFEQILVKMGAFIEKF